MHSAEAPVLLCASFAVLFSIAAPRNVTFHNNRPLLDTHGKVVDAYDGVMIYHDGMYYLYGERYGNATGFVKNWYPNPELSVYTSTDAEHWTDRGQMLSGSTNWPSKWVPFAFFDRKSNQFIAWYGRGSWGSAKSQDGIHYEVQVPNMTSRLGGATDGNALMIDDDGKGYVIFSATDVDHQVSIELLTADYMRSTKQLVGPGFFPDTMVEGPSLFRRGEWYYAVYGRTCCACQAGSGVVVFKARSVQGPWQRQAPDGDVNCQERGVPICGPGQPVTIPAQWFGVAQLPLASGGTAFVLMGHKWLSGPGAEPGCVDMCGHASSPACQKTFSNVYVIGRDLQYWQPLEFNEQGDILPFRALANFTLDLLH